MTQSSTRVAAKNWGNTGPYCHQNMAIFLGLALFSMHFYTSSGVKGLTENQKNAIKWVIVVFLTSSSGKPLILAKNAKNYQILHLS